MALAASSASEADSMACTTASFSLTVSATRTLTSLSWFAAAARSPLKWSRMSSSSSCASLHAWNLSCTSCTARAHSSSSSPRAASACGSSAAAPKDSSAHARLSSSAWLASAQSWSRLPVGISNCRASVLIRSSLPRRASTLAACAARSIPRLSRSAITSWYLRAASSVSDTARSTAIPNMNLSPDEALAILRVLAASSSALSSGELASRAPCSSAN
mmetsp:Transcript_3491/g.8134  ORF Transcript_3491/g.8134 Transcript_3491/m.8134 type:complete len:217 (+) Transcript_3491:2550-3200(+)